MSTNNEEGLQPTDQGDPNGDIMAALDKFFDEPQSSNESIQELVPDAIVEEDPVIQEKEEELPPIIGEDFFSDTPVEPEAKPPEPGAFDEVEFDKQTESDVKGMDVKAGEKFRALKAELKAAKQQSVSPDTQSKLDALELRAQETDGLKIRIAEISSQSAKLQVENEPAYQREVVEPATDIFTRSDALSALYETEPAILRTIIKERDRKVQNELIAEHLADFSDFDRNETYRMIQDFSGLIHKRELMMENAERTIESGRVSRIEADNKLMADQRIAVQTLQKNLWGKYKEHIPGLTEAGEDTPTMKKLMAQSMAIDFSRAQAKDQAFAAFAGVSLPHAVAQIADLKKRLSVYEKGDAKAVSTSPGAGSSVMSTPSGKPAMDFMSAMAQDHVFSR